jgi:hypothetical protein
VVQGVLLAAVLVLTALVLLDLALTLAVIRRLREQAEQRTAAPVDPYVQQLVGREVPEASAVATDGTEVTAELLRATSFVAFVATGCGTCHDELPQLRSHLEQRRSAGAQALVVVDGDGDDELVTALQDVVPVVVESYGEGDRSLIGGFEVSGFPTYLELEGRTVTQVLMTMSAVPAAASAPVA